MKIVPLDRQRLAEHGVDLVKAGGGWRLVCQECGHSWPVPVHVLPQSYWRCPNGCSEPKPKPKPEPEPEPEAEEDSLEKAIERELERYLQMQEAALSAETDEARARFENQAKVHYERYMEQLKGRSEAKTGGPEPQSDEQRRIEEAMDHYLTGGRK